MTDRPAPQETLSLRSIESVVSGDYSTRPEELAKSIKPTKEYWRGSSPGSVFEREIEGQQERWYVKFGRDDPRTLGDDQLRAEFIAQRIYRRLGFNVPETHLVIINKKVALAKRAVVDLNDRPNVEQLATLGEVKRGFLVDVYLNNWDITNNFGISGGMVYRFDSGSALDSRARGEPKEFKPLTELDIKNFRDPRVNYNGSRIYSQVQQEDLAEAATLIAGLTNEEIAAIVKAAGYEDKRKEVRIISTLIRRRENIKELFGVAYGRKPKELTLEEKENWQKLERLLPRDAQLESLLNEVRDFNEKILTPWVSSDIELLKSKIVSLRSPSEQPSLAEESYSQRMAKVTALEQEVAKIEQQLENGQIPEIETDKKRGMVEVFKLKVDRRYREQKMQEAREYCKQRREEIRVIVNEGYSELKTSLENSLAGAVGRTLSYQTTGSSERRPLLIDAPKAILETAQALSEARVNFERLKQYCEGMGPQRVGQEKELELRGYEEKISRAVDHLSEMWKDQAVRTAQMSVALGERIYGRLSENSRYGNLFNLGGIAQLLVVPTRDQEEAVVNFCRNGKQFLEIYKEFLSTLHLRGRELDNIEGVVKYRREQLKRRCEEIRSDRVCHMTLTHEEYAESILREGFLVSSMGQQKLSRRVRINSPAALRMLLPEVTFSINGAELQYGGAVQDLEDVEKGRGYKTGILAPRTKDKKEQFSGVGFVFPYTAVVEGHQFFEQISSQGQGYDHYNELHVFDPEYDGTYHRDDWEHSVVRIDINKGVFIAPESQRDRWRNFLLKSKEEGGAGKDEKWIEEHVRFYPDYTTPNDFIELADTYGGLNFPKTDQGILIPTGKSGRIGGPESLTPLFKWVTL